MLQRIDTGGFYNNVRLKAICTQNTERRKELADTFFII